MKVTVMIGFTKAFTGGQRSSQPNNVTIRTSHPLNQLI